MSAYKQLLASDVIITPFEVNKVFSFQGASELVASNVAIDRFLGCNTGSILTATSLTTGQVSTKYQQLVYSSVKHLYYSNYLSSSYGDEPNRGSILPGADTEGDILIGAESSTGRYDNYNQTNLTFPKYFPTASGSTIGVLSIPSRLFGNYIQPNSFRYTFSTTASVLESTSIGSIVTPIVSGTSTSGSIEINGVEFYVTTSLTLPPNEPLSNPPRIYLYLANSGSVNTGRLNLINAITASLNFSSSISPYDTYLSDITASRSGASLLLQAKTPGAIGNTYYVTGLIPPTSSIYFTGGSDARTIIDDGEGNLVSGSNICGNIFYYHGMAILTSGSSSDILNFVSSPTITCSFNSSLTVYEAQYKCTIRESEFNYTLNPSAELSGSLVTYSALQSSSFYQPTRGELNTNLTGSSFTPYVTTVGLYDDNQNLLAVGKLAQPLPTSATTDTTILVNIDR